LPQFKRVVDFNFSKTAGQAMFLFTHNLTQVGASIPHKVDQIAIPGLFLG
jgi:hypothetical protein